MYKNGQNMVISINSINVKSLGYYNDKECGKM